MSDRYDVLTDDLAALNDARLPISRRVLAAQRIIDDWLRPRTLDECCPPSVREAQRVLNEHNRIP